MNIALASVLASACVLASCNRDLPQPPPPSKEEEARIRQTGRSVADNLVKTLGGQMKAALESGGPVAAVTVCQSAAQPLTESVTTSTPEASVRRTSLKVRNPVNAPDDIDREILQQLAALPSDQLPADIIKWTPDTARFYKPLVTQEVCTKCHGDPSTFSPPLRSLLSKAYPDDQATGYAAGDLRGLVCVEFKRP